MNIYKLHSIIVEALKEPLSLGDLGSTFKILLAPENFGDLSLNISFKLAKVFKKSPVQVANDLIPFLKSPYFESISNDAGYINIKLNSQFYLSVINDILKNGNNYFTLEKNGKSMQVEFVSANPTGPLHVGNGRGGVIGDVVANVLKSRGFNVEKEYYVNDAGSKMDLFGASIRYYYLLKFGIETAFPEDGYKGDYIKDIADKIVEVFHDKFVSLDYKKQIEIFKTLGEFLIFGKVNEETEEVKILKSKKDFPIKSILETLESFNVFYDNIFFESSLYKGRLVEFEDGLLLPERLASVLHTLKERGLLYKHEGAWWFKATAFKDDKDRVLVRATGEPTYTLTDIAYHIDKFKRGHSKVIDVWGADHFGHVITMKALLEGVGIDPNFLDVILYQIVHLFEDGVEVKMSKHTGKFYTLSELVDEVGKDAARFFFLLKSSDTHLNFDIDLARKQSLDNPVYYVQYTYARLNNILEEAKKRNSTIKETLSDLTLEPIERRILNSIFYLNSLLDDIALDYSIHRIPNFTLDLCRDINYFYQNYQVLREPDITLRTKRFLLVKVALTTLSFLFDIMGIEKKEKM